MLEDRLRVPRVVAADVARVLLQDPLADPLVVAEAVEDAIATVKHAALQSDTISLNPVNVQRNTLVERLWKSWAYRPPWLWSVVEVLNSSVSIERRIVCEPTGAGEERGAHNCGSCDATVLGSIRRWSVSQERSRVEVPNCECRGIWESLMELEGLVANGSVDLQRMFRLRDR